MAYDKVIDSAQLDADLTTVADAIRAKTGTTGKLEFPSGFISDVGTLANAEDYLAAVLNEEIEELVNHKVIRTPPNFQENNTNLLNVSMHNLIAIESNAFAGCTNLRTVDLSGATKMYAGCFGLCSNLESIKLDSLQTIESWGYNFNQCWKLPKIDLPSFTGTITTNCFNNCKELVTIILRADTMVTLGHIDALARTPIESGTGYIYVKSALKDSYKTATNWSAFADQFRAIEDYPDICG